MLHPTRRKNEGKNPSRKHLELRERRKAFSRKKRQGKRSERKAARKKHRAARVRSRLDELIFGIFNVGTAAVNGVNGIDYIDTLLRPCAAISWDVIELCRRPKGTELPKSWHLDTASTSVLIVAGSKGRKCNMGLDWR